MKNSVLQAVQLQKAYKGRRVVDGVDLEVKAGQVVGLLGPNGAGKTTSFYMVVGLIRPDAGQVLLNGEDIASWPVHRRAQAGIAYLPQEASVFRRMTAEENILSVLETLPLTAAERHDRLNQLLDEFSIRKIAKQNAYTLSGGERRRVEVARALALNPVFLLLDEPFAGIDPMAVSDIQRMIQVLKKRGIGVLITDHNVRETLEICDLGYLVNSGKIFEKGTPHEIANSRTAREKYLGEDFQF
ncbi:MAG TPA: LPS export ABC transporter ATP-binding protein [Bdellovibrionales bacterium]|nr:MAG: LPS export ABC transporter ATP-binding protein [Bdellovibrionales bacterium GWB1_52_6]OFZ02497.1 MAG: LPS export ABC transporter ATP-binding protein [Bdellovibrionales bacterium GWA1_52_35]OFZ40338.1 MAG: LPS export ABC transporter ATP-binding protein [Bdellovibrionales bacterium GWC1_52_8]HAR41821.1 LPS export ABC transporter ATP-binding protein [Bdellovibrionales bacterium]HCM41342.1 LPS export ABC transporter ATP-binding protein [Bdellovibrionales bacterium]